MALVEVQSLSVELPIGGELKPVLRDVSLSIEAGEALALVGESGAGKSMAARAIARLLPDGAIARGSALVDGNDMLALRGGALRRERRRIATIFQDPRAHINPVRRIGDFMTETMRSTMNLSRTRARGRAVEALASVGIADGERRLRQFPHELSGGLLQRVMIATALLSEPQVILADEPTTALDVSTQSEVMAILDEVRTELGVALLFITHDLDLAAAVCDRTAVMYAGEIVEHQSSASLHEAPRHPYTAALTLARPDIDGPVEPLMAIPGRSVAAWQAGNGCAFAPRCSHRQPVCIEARPLLADDAAGSVRCIRSEELRGRAEPVLHG